MIRPMRMEEIPEVARLWASLFDLTACSRNADTPTDLNSVRTTLYEMMQSQDACVLVASDGTKIAGVIGGVCSRAFWNRQVILASERFWYVNPEYRGQGFAVNMLRHLEAWAKSRGAAYLAMGSLANVTPNLPGFYSREGYIETETLYTKRLTPLCSTSSPAGPASIGVTDS